MNSGIEQITMGKDLSTRAELMHAGGPVYLVTNHEKHQALTASKGANVNASGFCNPAHVSGVAGDTQIAKNGSVTVSPKHEFGTVVQRVRGRFYHFQIPK